MSEVITEALVWVASDGGMRWMAELPRLSPSTPAAFYEINRSYSSGRFALTAAIFDRLGEYATLRQAQAAADKHFSDYVRSLLGGDYLAMLPP